MIADENKFQETKIAQLRTIMAEFEDNSLLLGTAKHVVLAPKNNICHYGTGNSPAPSIKKNNINEGISL